MPRNMSMRMIRRRGWFTVTTSTRPTAQDHEGCDGLYVDSIMIHWWHPGAWRAVGRAIVRYLNGRLIIKIIKAC